MNIFYEFLLLKTWICLNRVLPSQITNFFSFKQLVKYAGSKFYLYKTTTMFFTEKVCYLISSFLILIFVIKSICNLTLTTEV